MEVDAETVGDTPPKKNLVICYGMLWDVVKYYVLLLDGMEYGYIIEYDGLLTGIKKSLPPIILITFMMLNTPPD